jgi:hypothetical protein
MKFLANHTSRAVLAAIASALMVGTLAGCTAAVSLEPAPDANNAACAEVTVRLPGQIDALVKRQTDAQATGAWGAPAAVIERCGLPQVLVSKLPCITAGGVDWLVDDSAKPSYRFISFARNPATEVIVDSKTDQCLATAK